MSKRKRNPHPNKQIISAIERYEISAASNSETSLKVEVKHFRREGATAFADILLYENNELRFEEKDVEYPIEELFKTLAKERIAE